MAMCRFKADFNRTISDRFKRMLRYVVENPEIYQQAYKMQETTMYHLNQNQL